MRPEHQAGGPRRAVSQNWSSVATLWPYLVTAATAAALHHLLSSRLGGSRRIWVETLCIPGCIPEASLLPQLLNFKCPAHFWPPPGSSLWVPASFCWIQSRIKKIIYHNCQPAVFTGQVIWFLFICISVLQSHFITAPAEPFEDCSLVTKASLSLCEARRPDWAAMDKNLQMQLLTHTQTELGGRAA